jgi:hypothetical protein
MKKAICLIFVLFSVVVLRAQSAAAVDSIVRLYPKDFSSADKLAQRIQSDFSTDFGKARAIFSWIAFNVRYDVKSYLHPKKQKTIKYKTEEERLQKVKQQHDKMIAKVLRKQKAVCSGYSELFNYVALKVGLESQVNEGDAKTRFYDIGRRRVKVSHAWNSVRIDGIWRLLDVTWGAGYVDLEKEKFYKNFKPVYFDTEPKTFFMRHYPKKGIWFDTVVDKDEFLKAPLVQSNILNKKYEIIEPGSGVINICQNDTLNFKILNVNSESDIEFSLKKKEETASVGDKNQIDDAIEFNIKIDKTIGRYLTLYVDGTAIATFKINRYKL